MPVSLVVRRRVRRPCESCGELGIKCDRCACCEPCHGTRNTSCVEHVMPS